MANIHLQAALNYVSAKMTRITVGPIEAWLKRLTRGHILNTVSTRKASREQLLDVAGALDSAVLLQNTRCAVTQAVL